MYSDTYFLDFFDESVKLTDLHARKPNRIHHKQKTKQKKCKQEESK